LSYTTLVLIDSSFERNSPSARGMVDLVTRLVEKSREEVRVEVWAHSLDECLEGKVRFESFRKRTNHRLIALILLSLEISFRFFKEVFLGKSRRKVYVSNGFLCPFADLVTVHFSGLDWFLKTWKLGKKAPQFASSSLRAALVVCFDIWYQWSPVSNCLVAVSRGVEADLQKFAAPWKKTVVIANPKADEVYCPAERERRSASIRGEVLQDNSEACVLGFCSLGHLRRKGFWLAVKAVALARQAGAEIHLLVIGNDGADLYRELQQIDANFERWIHFRPYQMFYDEDFYGHVLPWSVDEFAQALVSDWQQGKIKPGPASSNESLQLKDFETLWTQKIDAIRKEKNH